jgi:hypothetical protein
MCGLTRPRQKALGTPVKTFGRNKPICPKNLYNSSLTAARQRKRLTICRNLSNSICLINNPTFEELYKKHVFVIKD